MVSDTFLKKYRFTFFLLLAFCFVVLLSQYYENIISYNYANGEIENEIEEYPSMSNEFLVSRLRIDRSDSSRAEIVRKAQEAVPTFPLAFWEQHKNENLYYHNSSCARFPDLYRLRVNNLYWQIFSTTNETVFLYGAYYDVRKRCSVCPVVRLLAATDRPLVTGKTYCQIWFADSREPVIVESLSYFRIMTNDLPLNPYLITCPIPPDCGNRVPMFVSLVERMCEVASNSLRIIFDKPGNASRKRGFAVCVKMLDYLHEDLSPRLIEWIELVRLLGADKIHFYTLFVHENMTKVLKYYQQRGLVELTPTTLVGEEVNAPYFQHLFLTNLTWQEKWINEVIQVNDCFYKNMYKYDYITPFDTDEVIVPNEEFNWTSLMKTVLKKTSSRGDITSYQTRMVIFPNCGNVIQPYKDIPPYMYMLQHVFSDTQKILPTAKTFFDTEMMEVLNNHWGVKCLPGSCNPYWIERSDAELFHYRNEPYNMRNSWSCDATKNDTINTAIWKYKRTLTDRTLATLYNLGFYS